MLLSLVVAVSLCAGPSLESSPRSVHLVSLKPAQAEDLRDAPPEWLTRA